MSLVVGGIGDCVFYLCRATKFITNWNFEQNLDEWIGQPDAGMASRVEDTLTFWGEYSMRVNASANLNACGVGVFDTGAGVYERAFLLEFAVRPSSDRNIQIVVGDADHYQSWTKAYTCEKDIFSHHFYYFQFLPLGSPIVAPDDIEVKLYGTETELGIANYDNVNLYEVLEKITMRFPEDPQMGYDKELNASYELLSGKIQEYIRGWRFSGNLNYEHLTKAEEEKRTTISEGSIIVFQPHDDNEFMVVTRWNGKYMRNYFGNVFAGHTGKLNLLGAHLLSKKPQ